MASLDGAAAAPQQYSVRSGSAGAGVGGDRRALEVLLDPDQAGAEVLGALAGCLEGDVARDLDLVHGQRAEARAWRRKSMCSTWTGRCR